MKASQSMCKLVVVVSFQVYMITGHRHTYTPKLNGGPSSLLLQISFLVANENLRSHKYSQADR